MHPIPHRFTEFASLKDTAFIPVIVNLPLSTPITAVCGLESLYIHNPSIIICQMDSGGIILGLTAQFMVDIVVYLKVVDHHVISNLVTKEPIGVLGL